MIPRFAGPGLLAALVCLIPSPPGRADEASDLAALRARKIGTTGAELAAYFKKRTPTPEILKKIAALMAQLDADEQPVREKAAQGLVEMGPLARPRLSEALKEGDAEIRRRAKWALERIESPADDASLLPAAARVLAARKAEGGLEALLGFMAHIESADVADEVAQALPALALEKDGKPRKAALEALSSKSPTVRAAAGLALAKAAGAKAAVAKLLDDPSTGVKRRVALALLEAREKAAIPVLVALTGAESEDDAAAAEGALWGLAGDKAPEPPPSTDKDPRGATRRGWEKWWKEASPKFDIAKADLEGGSSAIALACVREIGKGAIKRFGYNIVGLSPDGNRKFTVENFQYPWHASLSRRDRILVCDSNNSRVVEVDLAGKQLWTRPANQPITAFRLRNGNMFIATRNQLVVLDRANKEIKTINRPGYDVASATMFEDGKISLFTTSGYLVKLDKDGKEISSKDVASRRGVSMPTGYRCWFGADGSMVWPDYGSRTVRKVDADGKEIWATSVPNYPSSITRLPSGNFIVTTTGGAGKLTELDRNGKEVKSRYSLTGQILFFERR